jgi:hypothetical protein
MVYKDLAHTHDFCRSRRKERLLAVELIERIRIIQPQEGSVLICLRLLLGFPTGGALLHGLHLQNLSSLLRDDWIHLEFRRPGRSLIIPNVLRGNASERALREFRNLHTPRVLKSIADETNIFLPKSLTYETFLALWEAALPTFASPVLSAISTLRFQAALPSRVDLAVKVTPHDRKRSFRQTRGTILGRSVSEFAKNRQQGEQPDLLHFMKSAENGPESVSFSAALWLIRKPRRKKVVATTIERQMRSIDKVLSLSNDTVQKAVPIYASDKVAESAIIASSTNELITDTLKRLNLKRKRTNPRDYPLINPTVLLTTHGLDERPDIQNVDLRSAALRIMLVTITHCGRRPCCVYQLALRDFKISWNPIRKRHTASVRISFTKAKAEIGMEIPIGYLWPIVELDHLARFLKMTAKLDPALTLMELAGGQRIAEHNIDIGYSELCQLLKSQNVREKRFQLHVPRITFASWWPIRILCAEHRYLLDELPYLGCLKLHPWFTNEALDRVWELVGGATGHSLNVVRQIMGHASFGEFLETYCRSWPLLFSLNSYISWRANRSSGFHQLLLEHT